MVHAAEIAGVSPLDLARGTETPVQAVVDVGLELEEYLESVGDKNPFGARASAVLRGRTSSARSEVVPSTIKPKGKPTTSRLAYRDSFFVEEGQKDSTEGTLFVTQDKLPKLSQSGRERNVIFMNLGTGRFEEVAALIGGDHIGDGRSLALADFDHDGDVDIVVRNLQDPKLVYYENTSPAQGHFLDLKLRGTRSNRDGVGAIVRVSTGTGTQTKQVTIGHNYLGQSSIDLEFGLGEHDMVQQIEVRWPSGTVQRFHGVKADRRLLVVEDQDTLETRP